MPVTKHNPTELFRPYRCYSHATEIRMRVRFLGTHSPSSTVVCCRLLDPKWKLEIEAMAAT